MKTNFDCTVFSTVPWFRKKTDAVYGPCYSKDLLNLAQNANTISRWRYKCSYLKWKFLSRLFSMIIAKILLIVFELNNGQSNPKTERQTQIPIYRRRRGFRNSIQETQTVRESKNYHIFRWQFNTLFESKLCKLKKMCKQNFHLCKKLTCFV